MSGDDSGVRKKYVVYIRENGRVETHGGPYAPLKAREVRDAMRMHAANGRHREMGIPEDTLAIEMVPPERLRELRAMDPGTDREGG